MLFDFINSALMMMEDSEEMQGGNSSLNKWMRCSTSSMRQEYADICVSNIWYDIHVYRGNFKVFSPTELPFPIIVSFNLIRSQIKLSFCKKLCAYLQPTRADRWNTAAWLDLVHHNKLNLTWFFSRHKESAIAMIPHVNVYVLWEFDALARFFTMTEIN